MNLALLVIDVQRELFDVPPRPFEADAVIARINGLSARARSAGVPVVFIQHEAPGSALAFESEGWKLAQGLDVQPGDRFVRKTTADAFLRTNLGELLQSLGVTRLVVCGYASEFCVDTTVRRAAALGYAVTLAADAHTTHDKAHAPAAVIRKHENATLPEITSFGPAIRAIASAEVVLGEVEFRPVTGNDGEALAALRVEAMRSSLERVGRFDPDRARARFLDAFVPECTQAVWVGGLLAGFFVVRQRDDGLLLDHLYLQASHQGRGIGAAVLQKVFAQADASGLDLRVGALRESDANRFYLRHGFVLESQAEFDNYYVRKQSR